MENERPVNKDIHNIALSIKQIELLKGALRHNLMTLRLMPEYKFDDVFELYDIISSELERIKIL